MGQPFGEALVIVGAEDGGGIRIKTGPAKGREIDAFVEAPEGYWVGVEFNYRHKTGDDKIALLKKDGRYPILEVDLSDWLDKASDDGLRQYIAGCNDCNRFNRGWLFLPSVLDICRQFAPEGSDILVNTSQFGGLRCCVPECTGKVCGGVGDSGDYCTLPRFACSDHALYPGILTLPEGERGFPWVPLE